MNENREFPKFRTSASAKWILAGEHSILRGFRAVSLPRSDLKLSLEFYPSESGGIEVDPPEGAAVFKKILQVFNLLRSESHSTTLDVIQNKINGKIKVSGEIPFGAGLGSSAALCLCVVRWISHFVPIGENEVAGIATLLENEFHGKSSGIDVATIYCGEPIGIKLIPNPTSDQKVPEIRKLGIKKTPRFTFHDTGLRASTKECIEKVQRLQNENTHLAHTIDQDMDQAAEDAEKGLLLFSNQNESAGLEKIAHAMKLAQSCFSRWGLEPPAASRLISELVSEGALAAKLTGSGGGGIVVALWESR